MKYAIKVYEELGDAVAYTLSSYLRMELSPDGQVKAAVLNAATAFLFDNLFAKEKAGPEITLAAKADLGNNFVANDLSEKATAMRLAMVGDDFAKGTSPFRNYVAWVAEEEPYVLDAFKDDAGKLALVYLDSLADIILESNKEAPSVRVAEMAFLNITNAFALLFREYLKESYFNLASIRYFIGVEESFEQIRKEILD